MKRTPILQILLVIAACHDALAIDAPLGLVSRTGDLSVVLHWDQSSDPNLLGYRVYRSLSSGGPFAAQNTTPLTAPGYCDLSVVNGQTYYYQVTALTTTAQESAPSTTLSAVPHVFADDNEFLEYVQQTSFDYFWYGANPANGLIPDRTAANSACSIAAVGFGLTAIGIGIDHGWISRTQGVARVLTTLNTFWQGPQGPGTTGTIGYHGWFYHFLDMNTALRAGSELSSIDTVLLLAGIIHSKEYFDDNSSDETSIRTLADAIVDRVDWDWMSRGTNAVSMGWYPESGFINSDWAGYDEGMILYCLGLGAATNPLPATSWDRWTSSYDWSTNYGPGFVLFPPLFGHEYSHCWIDFRHIADAYMNSHDSTYLLNSRRAAQANRAYCIANPGGWLGYSSNVWGLTACDGPSGYVARGAPPPLNDDGTIAPTAAGGAMAFTPEFSLPTLRYFYSHYRPRIWTAYGFRDAFNLTAQWWDTDELGIDQGPILVMIENYRTQRVWRRFMQNDDVQRGLQRAGFVSLPFIALRLQALPDQNTLTVEWDASVGRTYQVEYSPDLRTWFAAPSGEVTAAGPTASWTDTGPPGTAAAPFTDGQRFYRAFQLGSP